MPKAASHVAQNLDDGFDLDADERLEALIRVGHTDPRLGTFGRHMVRAAWMAENWGGGIAPQVLLGAGSSHPVPSDALPDDHHGLMMAESFLATALIIAEKRHMSVPDFAQPSTPVDPTAASLELWLAHIREKIGSPMALTRAAGACEKLFDATTDPVLRRALATRLALQCSRMGQHDESRLWMDRVMQESVHGPFRATVDKLLAREPLSLTPFEARQSMEALQALSGLCVQQATSLTEPERETHLREALRTQLAALRLAQESSGQPGTSGTAEGLHALWIRQKQAVLAMHVAETLYALHPAKHESKGWWTKLSHWLKRDPLLHVHPADYVGPSGTLPLFQGPHALSQEWLWSASHHAEQVVQELGTPDSGLLPVWKSMYEATSARLMDKAQRTQQEAELLLRTLRT